MSLDNPEEAPVQQELDEEPTAAPNAQLASNWKAALDKVVPCVVVLKVVSGQGGHAGGECSM